VGVHVAINKLLLGLLLLSRKVALLLLVVNLLLHLVLDVQLVLHHPVWVSGHLLSFHELFHLINIGLTHGLLLDRLFVSVIDALFNIVVQLF
jgi:hypothetical protein